MVPSLSPVAGFLRAGRQNIIQRLTPAAAGPSAALDETLDRLNARLLSAEPPAAWHRLSPPELRDLYRAILPELVPLTPDVRAEACAAISAFLLDEAAAATQSPAHPWSAADHESHSRRIQNIFDSIGDAFFALDREWRFALLNAQAEALLGRPREDLIGRSVWTAFPDAVGSRFQREYERAVREGVAVKFTEYYPPLGYWFHVHAYPSAAGLSVYFDNVNEQKHAEEALQRSEQRYRSLVEATSQIVWVAAPDGRVVESKGWCELTGQTAEAAAGTGWLDVVHADDREPTTAIWRDAIAGRYPCEAEFRVHAVDGSERIVVARGVPILEPDGSVREWVGTCTDITERKRAEAALQEADRAKDRFLALLSHELRNPVATVLNSVHLLQAIGAQDPRLARALRAIERAASSQAHLLDDLLDVARITEGKTTLLKEPVRLGEAAAAIVHANTPQGAARGIAVVAEVDDKVWVEADPYRLDQIIYNLVVNALKYTEKGFVEVKASREGDRAVLVVRDTGIGIAAHMVDRVFDMFSQEDASLAHAGGGLGLGLWLVRSLVELHDGTVRAASEGPGCGSTFTVELPAIERPQSRQDARDQIAPPFRSCRLLLVDDNVDARQSLRDILELDGFAVAEAGDGPSALAMVREHRPHVVLLDIGLPGIDGYEVAAQVRGDPSLAAMHLVALTGYGHEADVQRTRDLGFAAHLTKPVNLDTLRTVLSRLA